VQSASARSQRSDDWDDNTRQLWTDSLVDYSKSAHSRMQELSVVQAEVLRSVLVIHEDFPFDTLDYEDFQEYPHSKLDPATWDSGFSECLGYKCKDKSVAAIKAKTSGSSVSTRAAGTGNGDVGSTVKIVGLADALARASTATLAVARMNMTQEQRDAEASKARSTRALLRELKRARVLSEAHCDTLRRMHSECSVSAREGVLALDRLLQQYPDEFSG